MRRGVLIGVVLSVVLSCVPCQANAAGDDGLPPVGPPRSGVLIPEWLWQALYEDDVYPTLRMEDYVNNGKIVFRYQDNYNLQCDLGGYRPIEEVYPTDGFALCMGEVPALGVVPLTRPSYPIPSSKWRINAEVLPEDVFPGTQPVREEENRQRFRRYQPLRRFPLGHRLYLPPWPPEEQNKMHNLDDINYRDVGTVCVSRDEEHFGCLTTHNNGFYLDRYGTHTF